MIVIEIYFEARCKHCYYRYSYLKGKLHRNNCRKHNKDVLLRDKACSDFKIE